MKAFPPQISVPSLHGLAELGLFANETGAHKTYPISCDHSALESRSVPARDSAVKSERNTRCPLLRSPT